jgi:hypothetical protein
MGRLIRRLLDLLKTTVFACFSFDRPLCDFVLACLSMRRYAMYRLQQHAQDASFTGGNSGA